MAPSRLIKQLTKSKGRPGQPGTGQDILRKVQGGRLGRTGPTVPRSGHSKKATKQQGALFDNSHEETKPVKELFPALLDRPAQQPLPLTKVQRQNAGKELLPDLLQSVEKLPLNKATHKKPHKPSVKNAYLKTVNSRQSQIHQIQSGIAKRMLALHIEESAQPAQDLCDGTTVPYSTARLDADLTKGPSKLNISISCGFWGYTSAFSPSKIFTFSPDKFSTPEHLQRAIYNTHDIHEAGKQVGINLHDSSVAIVGYEVLFPKGYRYSSIHHTDIKNIVPVMYVSTDTRVLINTSCTLREFFHQAREYASDAFGNVSIPVIARLGLVVQDTIFTGTIMQQFSPEWRSEEEKKCAAEEKQLQLEQQQFADANQKAVLRKKLEDIEARAAKAVEDHRVNKMDAEIGTVSTSKSDSPPKADKEPEMDASFPDVDYPDSDVGFLDDDDISIDFDL